MFRTRTLCTLFVCALVPAGVAFAGDQGGGEVPATTPPAEPVVPPEPPAPRLTGGVAKWLDPNAVVEEEDPELAGAVDDTGAESDSGTGTTEPPPDPTTPPPPDSSDVKPGFTGIKGKVVDAKTGEGLIEASVNVVKGGSQSVLTEVDGSFELELAPGSYELRVFTGLYKGQRVRVVVQRGKAQPLTVKLVPEEDSTEEVLVEAKVQKRNEAAVLQVRKRAVAVSDVLSAQEISKTPDSNAGDAVKRVVSVTIIDGKYVVLRGLEGRYVQTLLNGVVLPSPEPDRNAVPLDLFPTALLANLTVIKSYSAELPGQFGGGALLIETNSYPEQFELKVGASTSANSSDTFKDGLSNSAGSASGDFFGFDDGSRDLPDPVPTNAPVRDLDNDYTEQIGEAFPDIWSTKEASVRPNFSVGAMVGDTRTLGGSKKLGYLATFSFRKGFDVRDTELRSLQQSDTAPSGFEVLSAQTNRVGEGETTVGGLINTGLELDKKNSISLFGLFTHVGEDASSHATGSFDSGGYTAERFRLQFVERQLGFAQLGGDHRLSNRLKLRWQGNAATTSRNELDSRDVAYDSFEDMPAQFRHQPGSGQRFFSFLDDTSLGGSADVQFDTSRLKLRGGAFAQTTSRQLDSRRFRYRILSASPEILMLPPEQMFSPEHIGPNFYIQEETNQEDAYSADLDVLGGHASAELEVSETLRAIAGVRYEHSKQAMHNGNLYAVAGNIFDVEYPSDDVFPSLNLVFAATPAMNLRGAYSYTVVRPRFRELAPFQFYDYVRGRTVSGNPLLQDTLIHHGDLRWEWFPAEAEVLAASVFAKQFDHPIEQVTLNPNNDAQFQNAKSATMFGGELEGRVGLGRWAKGLRDLKLGANVAVIGSQIKLDPLNQGTAFVTNKERSLYGQSPYLVNLSAGYANKKHGELTLLYNVIGRSISDVGVQGSPDIYAEPYHRVDVVASRDLGADLKLKASVANLLNRRIDLTQADIVVAGYSPGVAISIGLDWSP